MANSKRCEHGGALRHEASLLQRGGYCGATEAGKEAGLCGGRGPSKAASWTAYHYLQMWLMVINNEHLVRARPHSQVLVPGSALGYMTQGCSWVLPQVPGDMCLVQELGCQLGVPVRCKKGFGGLWVVG